MVSQLSNETVTAGKTRGSFVGLSTDTKPANAANGSTFFEMDTKKAYMYDESNIQWREI